MQRHSSLTLQGLLCEARLGCTADERAACQGVSFDVTVRFAATPAGYPRGCVTDELTDTACYAEISSVIRQVCARGEYRLIEKLGFDAFVAVRERLAPDTKLWIRAKKLRPPVEGLSGGASFCFGDWEKDE
jgi:dihydroneopterin aldolase